MLNTSEFVGMDLNSSIDILFPLHSRNSHVSLVRLATHERTSTLPDIAMLLKQKGYMVGINIMYCMTLYQKNWMLLLICFPQ